MEDSEKKNLDEEELRKEEIEEQKDSVPEKEPEVTDIEDPDIDVDDDDTDSDEEDDDDEDDWDDEDDDDDDDGDGLDGNFAAVGYVMDDPDLSLAKTILKAISKDTGKDINCVPHAGSVVDLGGFSLYAGAGWNGVPEGKTMLGVSVLNKPDEFYHRNLITALDDVLEPLRKYAGLIPEESRHVHLVTGGLSE